MTGGPRRDGFPVRQQPHMRRAAARALTPPPHPQEQPALLQAPQRPRVGRPPAGRPVHVGRAGAPGNAPGEERDLGPRLATGPDPGGLGLQLAQEAPLQPAQAGLRDWWARRHASSPPSWAYASWLP
jgi:hypothetical protein